MYTSRWYKKAISCSAPLIDDYNKIIDHLITQSPHFILYGDLRVTINRVCGMDGGTLFCNIRVAPI